MERRCKEVGVTFQPMIFESFGGVSVEAERVIKCLNKAVAVNTDISQEAVATQFCQWVGVDLICATCKSFHRGPVGHGGGVVNAAGPLGGSQGLQSCGLCVGSGSFHLTRLWLASNPAADCVWFKLCVSLLLCSWWA